MFGRFVEERLGKAHFFKIYFLSGIVGGILQSALMWANPDHFGSQAVGASAGACGLVAAFCLIEPDATLMAYFVIPVQAKWLLYFEAGITLLCVILPNNSGIAHGAHLGGILFAVAYVRWGLNTSRLLSD